MRLRILAVLALGGLREAGAELLEDNAAFKKCLDAPSTCTELLFENAGLTGPIPPTLGDLTALTTLNLRLNELTGVIPPELGSLVKLTTLKLHDNMLEGPLPTEMGKLIELTAFTLSSNKLTGAIPTEWSALVNLEHLSLAWNRLSGRIPGETFGSWKKMLTLELEWNNFSGNLPVEISAMTDLDSLVIGKNYFSGTLPGAIGDLKSLRNLFVELNLFSGVLPESIGDLPLLLSDHCVLTVTKDVAEDEDTFLHPFNAFWPPIPANISAKCNVIATKPFHLPAVVHKTCLGCLWNRCAVGSPCVKKQNIEDPRRNDREECMCECCAEHCKMDPRHIMNHHCAADSQTNIKVKSGMIKTIGIGKKTGNWANEIRPLGPTEIKLQSEDDSRSYSTLAQHAPVGMTLGVVSALIALAVLAKARGRGREAVSA